MGGPSGSVQREANHPSLLICLGAQKSGTTWLWNYLRAHPQCAVTPLKEVHFFAGGEGRLARIRARVEKRLQEADDPERLAAMHRFVCRAIETRSRPGRGGQDFAELVLSIATSDTRVAAEFTPANGQLAVRNLKELADLSIAPRFVMILREPVERLWSQIRMMAAKDEDDPARIRHNARVLVERFLQCPEDAMPVRYDYNGMLKRARRAVPADRLFIDFFETFMSQARIDAFCDFLGIDCMPATLDDPRGVGHGLPLAKEDRLRLRDALSGQYRAVERRLGKLPDEWYETLGA